MKIHMCMNGRITERVQRRDEMTKPADHYMQGLPSVAWLCRHWLWEYCSVTKDSTKELVLAFWEETLYSYVATGRMEPWFASYTVLGWTDGLNVLMDLASLVMKVEYLSWLYPACPGSVLKQAGLLTSWSNAPLS